MPTIEKIAFDIVARNLSFSFFSIIIVFVVSLSIQWTLSAILRRRVPLLFSAALLLAIGTYILSAVLSAHASMQLLISSAPLSVTVLGIGLTILMTLFRSQRKVVLERTKTIAPLIGFVVAWSIILGMRSTSYELPYDTIGNNDIWSYLKFANLFLYGDIANNIHGINLYNVTAYFQTPTATIILSLMALIFDSSPVEQFSSLVAVLLSLCAFQVYRVGTDALELGRLRAAVVALIWSFAGAVFLVSEFGFLAQLVALTIALTCLRTLLSPHLATGWKAITLACMFYILVLSYTTGFAAFLPVFGLTTVALWWTNHEPTPSSRLTRLATLLSPIVGTLIFLLTNPRGFASKVDEILMLSGAVAGWGYKLLNPLIFGLSFMPPDDGTTSTKVLCYALLVAASAFAAIGLKGPRGTESQLSPTATGNAIALLASANGALIIYALYFMYSGEGYQHWKLALSMITTVSFIWAALPFLATKRLGAAGGLNSIVIIAALVLVGWNVTEADRMSGGRQEAFQDYATLATISDAVGDSEIIAVDFDDDFESTMVLAQFVNDKKLELYSPSYYGPKRHIESLGPDTALLATKCDRFVAKTKIDLPSERCLLRTLLSEAQHFSFVGQIPPLVFSGLAAPEPWGTWTDGTKATFAIQGNPAWEAADVALSVAPYVSACVQAQNVALIVNGYFKGRWSLSTQSELAISVPRSQFGEAGAMNIELSIPNASAPVACGASDDPRLLGLGLISLSVVGEL